MRFLSITLLAALPVVLARDGRNASTTGTIYPASTTSSSNTAIQTVAVGKGGLNFTPSHFTAAVGSKVEFLFYSPSHSVAQSSFEQPCTPLNSKAFYSGEVTTSGSGPNTTAFTITINDTRPIWFYCGVPTHCEKGMAGVINPLSNGSRTLAAYQAAAANVNNSTTPSTVQGGSFVIVANVSTNASSTATSSVIATASSTATTSGNAASSSSVSAASATSSSGAIGNAMGSFELFEMGFATMMASVLGILL